MLYELCLRCGQFRFVPGMYCLDCGYIPPKLLDSDCVFRRMFSQPNNGRRDYFRRQKTGFWRKIAIGFSRLKISATRYSYIPITYGRGYFAGTKQSSTVVMFSRMPLVARN